MKAYVSTSDEVLSELESDSEAGLTSAQAAKRLETNGPNKLDEAKKDPLWKRLLAQLADPMIILLLAAAVISAVAGAAQGESDIADVVIILFVVVVNAVLGVVPTSPAEVGSVVDL